MRAYNRLKELFSNERGNALAIGAATLPLLIGSAALGVDTIHLSVMKRQLQRAADSGALAGAYALVQQKDVSGSVDHDLGINNSISLSAPRVVENAPTAGTEAGNPRAVRVVLTAKRSMPFMSFFNADPEVRAEATAAVVYAGEFCMVSLEDGNATGITFTGSTDVDLGCGVATNSTATAGVVASGSATVRASPVAARGGVPSSSGYVSPTTLLPYSPRQTDPYANLPIPAPPSGCNSGTFNVQPNQSSAAAAATSPGVICYQSYDIKGTWNIPSGSTVYVAGGTLGFGSQANVTCSGCTFILTGTAPATTTTSTATTTGTVNMHGGAVLNLSAPSDGIYKGVLMYQDPRAALGNEVRINGNTSSRYVGGFYLPRAYLTFNGNTGMQTECLQLVARRLLFSGNSQVRNECAEDSGADAFDAIFVRLVA